MASSDLDNIKAALGGLQIGSFGDLLAAFGLSTLPTAQRYGILVGCCVFFITISAVLGLLVFGGSFKRIADQSMKDGAPMPDNVSQREGRPLLLERLVEAKERMLKENYPNGYSAVKSSLKFTRLTTMLMNVAPSKEPTEAVPDLVDVEFKKKKASKERNVKSNRYESRTIIPSGYQENYTRAYRRCQDLPGGEILVLI